MLIYIYLFTYLMSHYLLTLFHYRHYFIDAIIDIALHYLIYCLHLLRHIDAFATADISAASMIIFSDAIAAGAAMPFRHAILMISLQMPMRLLIISLSFFIFGFHFFHYAPSGFHYSPLLFAAADWFAMPLRHYWLRRLYIQTLPFTILHYHFITIIYYY